MDYTDEILMGGELVGMKVVKKAVKRSWTRSGSWENVRRRLRLLQQWERMGDG